MKKIVALLLTVLMLFSTSFALTGCFDTTTPDTSQSTSNDNTTMGERMALASAKNYLRVSAFSKKGLIDQLEFEGYTTEEATYAVNNCGANWKEQAVKSAKNYLKIMPFSKQELIEQLEFEGYTTEEATYGVEQAYK